MTKKKYCIPAVATELISFGFYLTEDDGELHLKYSLPFLSDWSSISFRLDQVKRDGVRKTFYFLQSHVEQICFNRNIIPPLLTPKEYRRYNNTGINKWKAKDILLENGAVRHPEIEGGSKFYMRGNDLMCRAGRLVYGHLSNGFFDRWPYYGWEEVRE